MSNREIVSELNLLRSNGIFPYLDNGLLKVKLNQDAKLIDENRQFLQENKESIIGILSNLYKDNSKLSIVEGVQKYPLSFAQERLWLIDQLGGSTEYHMPIGLKIKGEFPTNILQETIQKLLIKHSILHTVVRVDDGHPYLVELDPLNWKYQLIDANGLGNNELEHLISNKVKLPFDLEHDYMLKTYIFNINAAEKIVLLVIHHLASDGWSQSILVDDFIAAFESRNQVGDPEISTRSLQYKDYAYWQRKSYNADLVNTKLEYWEAHLKGVEPLDLPYRKIRPTVLSKNGDSVSFSIDQLKSNLLQDLCNLQGVTMYILLLAILKVLLHKYTRQSSICIGSPIANRDKSELETMVGFFVNTVPINTTVDPADSFIDILQLIKKNSLQILKNQDVSFEKIIEKIEKQKDLSRSPIFQVMFAFQNTPKVQTISLENVEIEPLEISDDTSKIELLFEAKLEEEKLDFSIEYNTDCFDKHTIIQLAEHLKELVNIVTLNPRISIQDINLITQKESELLDSFKNNIVDEGNNSTVLELFEQQVKKYPQHIAIKYEDQEVTYEMLDCLSNELANFINASNKIEPKDFIGILLDRGLEMIVAIIAILKTGCAYVPIDPEYPLDRIDYILKDSNCKLVVDHNFLSQFDLSSKNNSPIHNSLVDSDICYIIYTSGTTGTPKGVMVEHRNVISLFKSTDKIFEFDDQDVWVMFHSYCFDFSVWEMYGALLFGGKLLVINSNLRKNAVEFVNMLVSENVTVLNHTPSYFYTLIEELNKSKHDLKLKYIIFGGEALAPYMLKNYKKNHPSLKIINMYGITETTVHCTYKEITEYEITSNISNIGKFIPSLNGYILDDHLRIVPIGIIGNIYVSGLGVSRGYLNKEELTKARFINSPFLKNDILYNSGDLGRWLPNGDIEYIGRNDHQVKIRGYRIELGEIENIILKSISNIEQVIVAVKENGLDRVLVAYYKSGDKNHDKTLFKAILKTKLPDYMIPTFFVEVEEIPLTNNGKVDRKRLPEVSEADVQKGVYEASRDETEEKLVKIWEVLLKREQVGIHDNFFELGGDSIISIQVVSKAKKAGIAIKARDIFEYQTIAKISDSLKVGKDCVGILTEQGELTGESPLLPIQEWFLETNDADLNHYNQDSSWIEVDRSIGYELLKEAVEVVLNDQDALKCRYKKEGDQWTQRYSQERIAAAVIEITPATDLEKIANDYQRELDIENGPIVKAVIAKRNTEEASSKLLIIIHHLAIDGISWRILMEAVSAEIAGIRQRTERVGKSRKGSSVRQWGERLKEYSKSEEIKSEINYWRAVIKASKPLRTDHSYEGGKVKDCQQVTLELTKSQTKSLLEAVNKRFGTEINDILLSSLSKALSDWKGQEKIIVGLEGHGREDLFDEIDISNTVGWFTSIYPVLLDYDRKLEMGTNIKNTKDNMRMIPKKGIGYGILSYYAESEEIREEFKATKYEIIFNYLGQFDNVVGDSTVFKVSEEGTGSSQGGAISFVPKLMINAIIIGGKLEIVIKYSEKAYKTTSIQAFAEQYRASLAETIDYCKESSKEEMSAWDYCLSPNISNEELEQYIKSRREAGEVVEGIYPLSPLQEGMLYQSLLENWSNAYMVQYQFDIESEINIPNLQASFDNAIQHHTILRTYFLADTFSIPVQVVVEKATINIEIVDLSGEKNGKQLTQIVVESDLKNKFDLSMAPLMRLILVKNTKKGYKLIWTSHHILFDGWSMPILMTEILQDYRKLNNNQQLTVSKVDHFSDHIQHIAHINQVSQQNFWKKYFSHFSEGTSLPFAKSSLNRSSPQGACEKQNFELNQNYTNKLIAFAKNNKITPNTIIQSAWSILLSKYCNNKDICFGTVVSGRSGANTQNKVGLYINTLPIRVNFNAIDSYRNLFQNLHSNFIHSLDYQHSSLSDIQQAINAGNNLFDSIIVFENYPIDAINAEQNNSLKIKEINTLDDSDYPLTISVTVTDVTHVKFEYYVEVLDPIYIQMIAHHFEFLLMQLIDNKIDLNDNIQDSHFLSSRERDILLGKVKAMNGLFFNNKEVDLNNHIPINLFFEKTVVGNEHKIALSRNNVDKKYHELNDYANQIAHTLIALRLPKGSLVGLYMNRGFNLVSAILAIFKAGHIYVPLDTDNPLERIGSMVGSCSISTVITDNTYKANLTNLTIKNIINLDQDWSATFDCDFIENQSIINPKNVNKINDIAYLLFTSGSTGEPKAAMTRHDGAMNHILAEFDHLDLADGFTFLQSASIGSDISIWQILSPLLKRGKIVIIDKEELLDIEKLMQILKSKEIDIVEFVPSYIWKIVSFLEEFEYRLDTALQWIMMVGEKVPAELVTKWKKFFPKCRVLNAYGPCEASDDVCQFEIVDQPKENVNSVPIGRPIHNINLFVLDEKGQLLPMGIAGEIGISGIGVGPGYYNNNELTRHKFIENPFVGTLGNTIYKSGDLGKWRPDGVLEFIGRIDRQVKFRGYRIELEEIESTVRKMDNVVDCRIIIEKTQDKNDHLICYVTLDNSPANTSSTEVQIIHDIDLYSQLKKEIKVKLPHYMRPEHIIMLNQFPINLSDKIDEKALISIFKNHRIAEPSIVDLVLPRNEREQDLADIIQNVLNIDKIGIYDDIFENGCNSLLSIRLIAKLNKDLSSNLSIMDIYEHYNIYLLSRLLLQKEKSNNSIFKPFNTNDSSRDTLYCIPGSGGHIMTYMALSKELTSLNVIGLQFPGLDGVSNTCDTIEDLASYYANHISYQHNSNKIYVAGFSMGCAIAFELIKQLQFLNIEVENLILFEGPAPQYDVIKEDLDLLYSKLLVNYLDELTPLFDKKSNLKVDNFTNLNNPQKLDFVCDYLSKEGYPNDYIKLFKGQMKVQMNDLTFEKNYFTNYELDNPGDVVLFKTDYSNGKSEFLGWEKYVKGNIVIEKMHGTHDNLLSKKNTKKIASVLNNYFNKTE